MLVGVACSNELIQATLEVPSESKFESSVALAGRQQCSDRVTRCRIYAVTGPSQELWQASRQSGSKTTARPLHGTCSVVSVQRFCCRLTAGCSLCVRQLVQAFRHRSVRQRCTRFLMERGRRDPEPPASKLFEGSKKHSNSWEQPYSREGYREPYRDSTVSTSRHHEQYHRRPHSGHRRHRSKSKSRSRSRSPRRQPSRDRDSKRHKSSKDYGYDSRRAGNDIYSSAGHDGRSRVDRKEYDSRSSRRRDGPKQGTEDEEPSKPSRWTR